jgi:protein-tyrosine phosphatase
MVDDAGLTDKIFVDSAGTAAWHIGKSPDARSTAHAKARGYNLSALRARQAVSADFDQFDYVLAMDKENLSNLQDICPNGAMSAPQLFLYEFSRKFNELEVPDPYYGGEAGFEHVLDLVEDACESLLADIKKQL